MCYARVWSVPALACTTGTQLVSHSTRSVRPCQVFPTCSVLTCTDGAAQALPPKYCASSFAFTCN
jgi:hypothetical protein